MCLCLANILQSASLFYCCEAHGDVHFDAVFNMRLIKFVYSLHKKFYLYVYSINDNILTISFFLFLYSLDTKPGLKLHFKLSDALNNHYFKKSYF
jgi:hypothetical protein